MDLAEAEDRFATLHSLIPSFYLYFYKDKNKDGTDGRMNFLYGLQRQIVQNHRSSLS
jgi:hypothetical protein